MHSLQQQIESLLCPHGFEVHPFLTGWYNQLVAPKFHLDHPEDTLAFVIISQPAMFEKAFLPFLSSHYRPGLAGRRDPIDECMLHQLSRLASVSASVVTLHDFQLTSSRRPRVLVQTAGHVAGAVTFYQPQVTRARPVSGDYTPVSAELPGAGGQEVLPRVPPPGLGRLVRAARL